MKSPLLCYAMNYPKIKLHRQHIPINSNVCIHNQVDYDYYISVLLYLHNQINLGFEPAWLISYHYFHPVETAKPLKETDKPYGYGDRYSFKTYCSIS